MLRRTLLVVVLALVVSACGGATSEEEASLETARVEDGSVELSGNDQLEFLPSDVTATSGDLTIALECTGPVPHTVVIEETEEVVTECGGQGEVSLEPGDYTFYCSVRGHRPAGMEGTLRVEG